MRNRVTWFPIARSGGNPDLPMSKWDAQMRNGAEGRPLGTVAPATRNGDAAPRNGSRPLETEAPAARSGSPAPRNGDAAPRNGSPSPSERRPSASERKSAPQNGSPSRSERKPSPSEQEAAPRNGSQSPRNRKQPLGTETRPPERKPAPQNDTVALIDTVRGAPSQAAFSVIADRYAASPRLFATSENSVERRRSLRASPRNVT